MWRFEMQFSTLFQKERKDEARVCYKEALRWLLSLNQNYFSIVYSDFFRLWPTYVIAMNNLATVTDDESDIEVKPR